MTKPLKPITHRFARHARALSVTPLVQLALACGALAASAAPAAAADAGACDGWPAYRAFAARFIQSDGRVIDFSMPDQRTTSEGQSYAMFFALVANDRATFDRLLGWTRANLAGNQFGASGVRLPAWLWGKKPDGSYGVLDPNSASDADLWIAWDLLAAGRLWRVPDYTALGTALATQIAQHEVADLPGLGPMLLPGSVGFVNGNVARLNPSYLPLPVLRGLATAQPGGPWGALAQNALRVVRETAPKGFAPDWVAWRDGQFVVDQTAGDVGSYDAIRVYLWAGLASPADPLAKPWLASVSGMEQRVAQAGFAPEKVAATTGVGSGVGPLSYWGALAPYFGALSDTRNAGLARERLQALSGDSALQPPNSPRYYDWVLGLFGAGAVEGRYRFEPDGRLAPAWKRACD